MRRGSGDEGAGGELALTLGGGGGGGGGEKRGGGETTGAVSHTYAQRGGALTAYRTVHTLNKHKT